MTDIVEQGKAEDSVCSRTGLPHSYWPQGNCQYCGKISPVIESIRSRAEKAEAERDELQKALDSAEIEHGLTDNGNLWRWWSAKAKELVKKHAELEADKNQALDLCAAAVDDYNDALATCEKLAKALEESRAAHLLLIAPQHIVGSSVVEALTKVTAAELSARTALSAYRKEASE